MAENSTRNEVQLGKQGRLVIPASLRKDLNLQPGDRLVARKVGDSLVLERREAVESQLQDRFRAVPSDVDLAGELIAQRRSEAEREG